jgi:hypothetical protein
MRNDALQAVMMAALITLVMLPVIPLAKLKLVIIAAATPKVASL